MKSCIDLPYDGARRHLDLQVGVGLLNKCGAAALRGGRGREDLGLNHDNFFGFRRVRLVSLLV